MGVKCPEQDLHFSEGDGIWKASAETSSTEPREWHGKVEKGVKWFMAKLHR